MVRDLHRVHGRVCNSRTHTERIRVPWQFALLTPQALPTKSDYKGNGSGIRVLSCTPAIVGNTVPIFMLKVSGVGAPGDNGHTHG